MLSPRTTMAAESPAGACQVPGRIAIERVTIMPGVHGRGPGPS